jgi:putative SOS response-associated peptidase YedK
MIRQNRGNLDLRPMAFAGLWESYENQGELDETCAILTTEANELAAQAHSRMPTSGRSPKRREEA